MSRVSVDPGLGAGAPALDDLREQLAAGAARTERRNRPTAVLVFSGVLLVVALVSLLGAWRSRAAAASALRDEQFNAAKFVSLAGELREVQAELDRSHVRPGENIPQMFSRIQNAGTEAGMLAAPPIPEQDGRPTVTRGSITRNRITVRNAQDPSLEALFRWLELAVERVPGLEVNSIVLSPGPDTWRMDVTFTRWEKKEGA